VRKRFAIGEIVGFPRKRPGTYWFVKEHGADRIDSKYGWNRSTETLEHYPTRYVVQNYLAARIRSGELPLLPFISYKQVRAEARRFGISSSKEWNVRYREIPRAPFKPKNAYKEWVDWYTFFGHKKSIKHLAIGEIVGPPYGWKDSYWFVLEHGQTDRWGSRELIQHWPTGLKESARVRSLNAGEVPRLRFQSLKHLRVIRASITCHYRLIVGNKSYRARQYRNYKNLPFQKEWNPKEGGSLMSAVWEIGRDLGPKPSPNHHLGIIVHSKGFVRGNLHWVIGSFNQFESKCRAIKAAGVSEKEAVELVRSIYARAA
jgi:hypothetical protein